jgi:hypothetical protein
MMPTNDWRLLDYFSASLGPQATRGQMSINQTNAAAWSAVLSGVAVTTLDELPNKQVFADDVLVEPASYDPRVHDIVAGITATKTNGTWTSLGDILAVPQLTSASPFLNAPYIPDGAIGQTHRFLRDEDYERIPQQIMGLLTVANGGPRFVIYTFAQTLTPDEVNTGSSFFKLPINYRVSSETATRTVLRLEYDHESEDPFDPDYNEPDFDRPRMVVESYNLLPLE